MSTQYTICLPSELRRSAGLARRPPIGATFRNDCLQRLILAVAEQELPTQVRPSIRMPERQECRVGIIWRLLRITCGTEIAQNTSLFVSALKAKTSWNKGFGYFANVRPSRAAFFELIFGNIHILCARLIYPKLSDRVCAEYVCQIFPCMHGAFKCPAHACRCAAGGYRPDTYPCTLCHFNNSGAGR
jgi:hypothetical protein